MSLTLPGHSLSLDDIDERLLALLREDARQSIAHLAKALGISRGQIYSRLSRLEDAGIVAGYTVRLGAAFVGRACARTS
jgi:DNA-binding Lrp family transcriptional regulator